MYIRRKHDERLRAKDIIVQTEYQDQGRLKIRRSDRKVEDDVVSGVILDKKYYLRQALRHQETEFNPGILYSFVFPTLDGGLVLCPNCGGVGEAKGFSDGCPYCGSYYNLEYDAEDRGSRSHSDYVNYTKDRVLPMVLSILTCVAVVLLITLTSGRTLRPFDFIKGLAAGFLGGAALGFGWIYLRSKGGITDADRQKKARQECELQQLKECLKAAGSSMSEYTNSLVYELEAYFYGDRQENADVIDFDLLDYLSYSVSDDVAAPLQVDAKVLVRVVRFRSGRLRKEEQILSAALQRNESKHQHLKPGTNFRSCPNCGASLDITQTHCSFCGASIKNESPFLLIRMDTELR